MTTFVQRFRARVPDYDAAYQENFQGIQGPVDLLQVDVSREGTGATLTDLILTGLVADHPRRVSILEIVKMTRVPIDRNIAFNQWVMELRSDEWRRVNARTARRRHDIIAAWARAANESAYRKRNRSPQEAMAVENARSFTRGAMAPEGSLANAIQTILHEAHSARYPNGWQMIGFEDIATIVPRLVHIDSSGSPEPSVADSLKRIYQELFAAGYQPQTPIMQTAVFVVQALESRAPQALHGPSSASGYGSNNPYINKVVVPESTERLNIRILDEAIRDRQDEISSLEDQIAALTTDPESDVAAAEDLLQRHRDTLQRLLQTRRTWDNNASNPTRTDTATLSETPALHDELQNADPTTADEVPVNASTVDPGGRVEPPDSDLSALYPLIGGSEDVPLHAAPHAPPADRGSSYTSTHQMVPGARVLRIVQSLRSARDVDGAAQELTNAHAASVSQLLSGGSRDGRRDRDRLGQFWNDDAVQLAHDIELVRDVFSRVSWWALTESQAASLVLAEMRGREVQEGERAVAAHRLLTANWSWLNLYGLQSGPALDRFLNRVHDHLVNEWPVVTNLRLDTQVGRDVTLLDELTSGPDARFKNFWQTGSSGGQASAAFRGSREENFGYAATLRRTRGTFQNPIPDAVRDRFDVTSERGGELPLYASLISPYRERGLSDYGDAAFFWKPWVRGRTTVTPQDSLSSGIEGARGVTALRYAFSLLAYGQEDVVRLALAEASGFSQDPYLYGAVGDGSIAVGDTVRGYFEAQVHGGLAWADVDYIVLNGDHARAGDNAARLQRFAQANGFDFTVSIHNRTPPPNPYPVATSEDPYSVAPSAEPYSVAMSEPYSVAMSEPYSVATSEDPYSVVRGWEEQPPHAAPYAPAPAVAGEPSSRPVTGGPLDLVVRLGEESVGSYEWWGDPRLDPADGFAMAETNLSGRPGDFARWIRGTGPEPTSTGSMNSEQAVLFTAYRAGVVKREWLVRVHDAAAHAAFAAFEAARASGHDQADAYGQAHQAYTERILVLSSSGRPTEHRLGPDLRLVPLIPRGHWVSIDDARHVALALGTRDDDGRQQVLSHSRPSAAELPAQSTPGHLRVTTIEELLEEFGTDSAVTSVAPAWAVPKATSGVSEPGAQAVKPAPFATWQDLRRHAPVTTVATERAFDAGPDFLKDTAPKGDDPRIGRQVLVREHVQRIQAPNGQWVRYHVPVIPVKPEGGVGAEDVAALQDELNRELTHYVNERYYALPKSKDQLHVDLRLVVAPAHGEAVEVVPGVTARTAARLWGRRDDILLLLHEVLHPLGLSDEYLDELSVFRRSAKLTVVGSDGIRREEPRSAVKTDGLMAEGPFHPSQPIPARHLKTIEDVVDSVGVLHGHSLDDAYGAEKTAAARSGATQPPAAPAHSVPTTAEAHPAPPVPTAVETTAVESAGVKAAVVEMGEGVSLSELRQKIKAVVTWARQETNLPSDEQQACLMLIRRLAKELFPAPDGARGTRSAGTVDDTLTTSDAVSLRHLDLPASDWAPAAPWQTLIGTLTPTPHHTPTTDHTPTAADRAFAVFVIANRPGTDGHAWAWISTADHGVQTFDPHIPSEFPRLDTADLVQAALTGQADTQTDAWVDEWLRPANPEDTKDVDRWSPTDARTLTLNTLGHAIKPDHTIPTPQSESYYRSITDPTEPNIAGRPRRTHEEKLDDIRVMVRNAGWDGVWISDVKRKYSKQKYDSEPFTHPEYLGLNYTIVGSRWYHKDYAPTPEQQAQTQAEQQTQKEAEKHENGLAKVRDLVDNAADGVSITNATKKYDHNNYNSAPFRNPDHLGPNYTIVEDRWYHKDYAPTPERQAQREAEEHERRLAKVRDLVRKTADGVAISYAAREYNDEKYNSAPFRNPGHLGPGYTINGKRWVYTGRQAEQIAMAALLSNEVTKNDYLRDVSGRGIDRDVAELAWNHAQEEFNSAQEVVADLVLNPDLESAGTTAEIGYDQHPADVPTHDINADIAEQPWDPYLEQSAGTTSGIDQYPGVETAMGNDWNTGTEYFGGSGPIQETPWTYPPQGWNTGDQEYPPAEGYEYDPSMYDPSINTAVVPGVEALVEAPAGTVSDLSVGGGQGGFGLGGVPAEVGWGQARWAYSWGLEVVPGAASMHDAAASLGAGPGSLYAAVLGAFGGSPAVGVGGRVFDDPVELRASLGQWIQAEATPLQRWPQVRQAYTQAIKDELRGASPTAIDAYVEARIASGEVWEQVLASVTGVAHWSELEDLIAPVFISEFLGRNLLVLGRNGRMSVHGVGPALVMARGSGSGGAPRWVGLSAAVEGPVLEGLSPAHVVWAADAGMAFAGPRGGGDLFDALVAAGRAGMVEALPDDPRTLRRVLERKMRADVALAGSPDWESISAEYVRAAVRAAGVSAGESARRRLEDGRAWQEIIAAVRGTGDGGVLTGALPAVLAQRYLPVSVRTVEADGQERVYGEGPDVTVARLGGADAGRSGDVWVGLAPVGPARALGAGTRPAEVAGGWSTSPAPAGTVADVGEPVLPVGPVGRAPAGLSPAQREWALVNRPRFVEVTAGGVDGMLEAMVQATGGGFTAGKVFVADAGQLRRLVVEQIDHIIGTDLGLSLVVYTIYADLWQHQRVGPAGQQDTQALSEDVNARIDDGRALRDIVTSIAKPAYWPELAVRLLPYFVNRMFGLAVRELGTDGGVDRYGDGRPVYIARTTADASAGGPGWVALLDAEGRFAGGAPLASPNRSDPGLARLGPALAAAKRAAGGAAGGGETVMTWLRGRAEGWRANTSASRPDLASSTPDERDVAWWDPDRLALKVEELNRMTPGPGDLALSGAGPGAGDRVIAAGVGLGAALRLLQALFDEHGGVHAPAMAAGAEQGEPPAGPTRIGEGIEAGQWVTTPSLKELLKVIPDPGAVLFFDDARSWVVVRTTDGLWLVEFDPADPAGPVGRVIAPNSEMVRTLDHRGVGLVIDDRGATIPAAGLDERSLFKPATDWDGEFTTEPAPASALEGISAAQHAWTREHQLRFDGAWTGPYGFYNAAINAAGGQLTVRQAQVFGPAQLRRMAGEHLPRATAGWPNALIRAAFRYETQARILGEFLGNDLSQYHPQAVHQQISTHLTDGNAVHYIEQAFSEPGHWEQIVDALSPAFLADLAERYVLVLGTDKRVRGYGNPAAPRLLLARTDATPAGWATLTPLTTEPAAQHTEPFTRIEPDIHVGPTDLAPANAPAELNGPQQQTAEQNDLRIQPTPDGDLSSAILTAAGGILLIDRDTYLTTPTDLPETLAGLIDERRDLLDTAPLEQISQTIGEPAGIDHIIDVLSDPTAHTEPYIRHLSGRYFGYELRVIEPDGTITTHGTGQPITIAPTTGPTGTVHWAALTPADSPTTGHSPATDRSLATDQPPITGWNPDRYTRQQPGTPAQADEHWRSSSVCATVTTTNEQGEQVQVRACVSVAVITLDRPHAGRPTATDHGGPVSRTGTA
ncbi:hypothetical protein [Actinoallomurus sp. NPDC050550]|uniref:hypothetical protein n=1 Tax=Actinoallomurus sp. NPDC050550 TaxID=3154937 RepID=UPI0033F57DE0